MSTEAKARAMVKVAELSTKLGIIDRKIKAASPSKRQVLEVQSETLKRALTMVSRELLYDWKL